jgi:hypothetical protein
MTPRRPKAPSFRRTALERPLEDAILRLCAFENALRSLADDEIEPTDVDASVHQDGDTGERSSVVRVRAHASVSSERHATHRRRTG